MYYLLKFILISEYLLQGEQSIALTGFTPAGLIQLRGTPVSVWCRMGLWAKNLSSYHPKKMRVMPLENL